MANKQPRYQNIDGMNFLTTFHPPDVRAASNFTPSKEDVVIVTYPKCGTTYMQQVVYLILNGGKPITTKEEYFSKLPFLEMTPLDKLDQMSKPRTIKTHLPFERLTFSKYSKYIYVARNPADCAMSFYHHARFFPIYFFDGDFDDFFEVFIEGKMDWGDYFDHLLSGYERRDEPNVMFVTYESLRTDSRGTILKVARFLGEEHYKKVTDNGGKLLEKILEYSSLDFMKKTVNQFWKDEFSVVPSNFLQEKYPTMENYAKVLSEAFSLGYKPRGDFVRKGAVGQASEQLSKEQRDRLEKRIHEKTSHSDVMKLWENV